MRFQSSFFKSCRQFYRYVIWLLLAIYFLLPATVLAEETESLPLDADTDVSLSIFAAKGDRLLIWFPSFATPYEAVETISRQLQTLGIEVWYADLLEAHFLPKAGSSVYQIPSNDILAIIDHAAKVRNKKIYIFAENRATIPVFHALHERQIASGNIQHFAGVILNSPDFYVETPDPGMKADLMPVVGVTNLPVYILQPALSPRYWQLQDTLPVLQQSGSDVFVKVLKKIRGRFHFRPDATDDEVLLTDAFGKLIDQGMHLLDTVNQKPRQVSKQQVQRIEVREGKKDRYLQAYQGDPVPPPLRLTALDGDTIDLKQLTGKVVLVNFWASWCPPCVHEMPSMQRLSEKLLGDPFIILGVNIAEEKSVVEAFLQSKVNVDFPVLLDSDGSIMRQWKVMAFPTSFVIDKKGKIRYALFGSIDWNTAEIINKIASLVKED